MRQGEIQFHSKIESAQNMLSKVSDRLLVLWPNNHQQHCISTDYFFFLPDNNHLDLMLNKTNIKINSFSQLPVIDTRDRYTTSSSMCGTVNKKFKTFQQKV